MGVDIFFIHFFVLVRKQRKVKIEDMSEVRNSE